MPFAQFEDVRIHYELTGLADAPVLVFSNSLGATFSMWDAQMTALGNQFRILRYDTRGHGQSSVTPGPYNFEQLAGDVLGLLDQLKLDRVHFCGLSMGGQTGLWLALHAPGRLHKLVLCNTAAKIGSAETWNARVEAIQKGGMKAVSTAVMERWFSPKYRTTFPDALASTKLMFESANSDGYIANCVAIREFDARGAIAAIHVPTLVIAGTSDAATTPAEGRYLADRIAGARYVELNAAHLSNIEDREHFTTEVKAFLISE
jgi:3-oxoadipate enol-lactonase